MNTLKVVIVAACFLTVGFAQAGKKHGHGKTECHAANEAGHKHGENCGHKMVQHGDHQDFNHDGQLHKAHGDHFDDHGTQK